MIKGMLWLEWAALFLLTPLVLRLGLLRLPWFLPLFAVMAAAMIWLAAKRKLPAREWWAADPAAERRQLGPLLRRFAASGLAMLALALLIRPEALFELPRSQPLAWLALLIIYPLLSVYPQELVYRLFFFERYGSIFPAAAARIGASALAFGWMHLVYGNLIAIGLTLAGGWYFADTYAKTGSLRLATLEHALYGNLIFTIGLGEFFSHTEVRPFEQTGLIGAIPWQRIAENLAGWF